MNLFDLRSLRDEGVLVVGSGVMTHGVRHLTQEQFQHGAATDLDAHVRTMIGGCRFGLSKRSVQVR